MDWLLLPIFDDKFPANYLNYGKITLLVTIPLVLSLIHLLWQKTNGSGVGRLPPGPKGLWLLGNAHQLWKPRERFQTWLKWAEKGGSCFTVQIVNYPVVLLSSPDYVQKLLASNENAYLEKGFIYKLFSPFGKDGLLVSHLPKWRERRKMLTKAFTYQSLLGYMEVFNIEGQYLVEQLLQAFPPATAANLEAEVGKPLDHFLWRTALRVVCASVMGANVWEMEDEGKVTESIEACKSVSMNRITKPWLLNDFIFSLHPAKKLVEKAAGDIERFTRTMIRKNIEAREQRQEEPETTQVLGKKKKFVSMIEEMLDAGIDVEGIVEECQTFMVAGYETTASTLHFLLFLLASNPSHQEACRLEVDEVFDNPELCKGKDEEITYEGLNHLKCLERCISEALRIFPVGIVLLRRIEKPLKLDDDIVIPANTNVGAFALGVHRNPEVYPNPNKFDPDRWLPENGGGRSVYEFFPFSAGPRNCIGNKFAMMEMRVVVARVLRYFTLETTDKLEDIPVLTEVILMPERPYNFILKRRQHQYRTKL